MLEAEEIDANGGEDDDADADWAPAEADTATTVPCKKDSGLECRVVDVEDKDDSENVEEIGRRARIRTWVAAETVFAAMEEERALVAAADSAADGMLAAVTAVDCPAVRLAAAVATTATGAGTGADVAVLFFSNTLVGV